MDFPFWEGCCIDVTTHLAAAHTQHSSDPALSKATTVQILNQRVLSETLSTSGCLPDLVGFCPRKFVAWGGTRWRYRCPLFQPGQQFLENPLDDFRQILE